jgi:hypothetical protein
LQRSCDDGEDRNPVDTPLKWDIFIEAQDSDVVARMVDWLGM